MLPTMYPTGILVVTLLAAVFADVGDLQPQGPTDQGSPGSGPSQSTALVPFSGSNDGKPLQMSEFCFFGKFPSATCRFRCHLMDMDAYCIGSESGQQQSGEGKCSCKPVEIQPETTPEEAAQDVFAKPETHKEQEAEKTKKPEGQKTTEEGTPSHETSFTIPMHTAPQEPEEDQNKHHVVFYIFDLNKIFGPQNETKSEGAQTEVPEPQAAPAGWAFQHFIAILIIVLLLVLIALELYACYKKQISKNNDMETIFKNIPMPNKA